MINIDPTPSQDKTEQVVQFPKSMELKNQLRKPHRGMFLWEVGYKSIEQVKLKVSSLPKTTNTKGLLHKDVFHEVHFDPNRYYCWAVNKRNAWKKFLKDNNFDPETPMP